MFRTPLNLFVLCAVILASAPSIATDMFADHPGFSDASSTLNKAEKQLEFGIEGAVSHGSEINLAGAALIRWGIGKSLEARLELPALVFADGSPLVDTLELGVKKKVHAGKKLSLAVLPAFVAPAGGDRSSVGLGVSVGLIADYVLSDALALTVSAVPRGVRSQGNIGQTESSLTFDVAVAVGLGYAVSKKLGVYVEGWSVLAEHGSVYAGDLVLTLLVDKNTLLDAYVGVQNSGSATAPYFGVGYCVRL